MNAPLDFCGNTPLDFSRHRRLVIFGGVYGNLAAFDAFLAAVGPESAPMICTGDLAAYCADGAAVCRKAKSMPDILFIRGNSERALFEDDDDCGCGFEPDSKCSLLSVQWYRHARETIGSAEKQWMGSLPVVQTILFGGRSFAVVHASDSSDNEFIFPSTSLARKLQVAEALGVDGIIGGHSGIPFTQTINGVLWHNSGALGMPANDGTSRVWYSEWTLLDNGCIHIEHIPLFYDIAAAQQSMKSSGLPDDYALTLSNGIWPSDSVLPPAEREQQGIALDLSSVDFPVSQ